jgi:hypothetical protein
MSDKVLVPYDSYRRRFPCIKPVALDTHGRAMPWCAAAVFLREDPEFPNAWYAFQTTWSDRPAMYFVDMQEAAECTRLALGINEPASTGWEFRWLERGSLVDNERERQLVFHTDSETGSTWMQQRIAKPFEVAP